MVDDAEIRRYGTSDIVILPLHPANTVKPKTPIPPLYFLILLLASIGLGIYLPIVKVRPTAYRYVGIVAIVIGVVLNSWADSMFKKNKTTVKPHLEPTALLTSGPFRFTRNTMYLGMTLVLVGVSVCVESLSAFVSPLLFFVISDRSFIPLEEASMGAVFGHSYMEYKQRVRRWV